MFERQSGCMGLHPATRIFLWVCLIIGQSYLNDMALYALAGALTLVLISAKGLYARRILWRSRFLLLTLIAVYPWSTPGVYIVKSFGAFSPTYEGVCLAGLQLLHTGIVLIGLGWAQGGLSMDKRLESLLFWVRPLHYLGVSVERFVVRLALTLQLLESAPRLTSFISWRSAWQQVLVTQSLSTSMTEVSVDIAALNWMDYWAMILASSGVVLCVGL